MVAVAQFGLKLRDGPVSSEASEAEPAEDVPGDEPPGQGDLGLGQGAEGLVVSGTGRIRAVSQFADQFERTFQRKDAVEPMVADVKMAFAQGAALLLDRQDDLGERGILRPTVAHGCSSCGNSPAILWT